MRARHAQEAVEGGMRAGCAYLDAASVRVDAVCRAADWYEVLFMSLI
jgi:hypothetical protein